MENNLNYRYPGVNYFTKKDKAIFCGREEDVNNLYTQVMLSKTLVLHAESGTGKSSVIQAGFLPLLEEKQNESVKHENHLSQFFPITVRFDFLKRIKENKNQEVNHELLINGTISKIEAAFPDLNKIKLPYLDNINTDSLWCIAKKLATNKIKLLLIFDQFEELQSYPTETITFFKKELAELLSNEIPTYIYDEIRKVASENAEKENLDEKKREEFNDNIKFFEKALEAKIIFVVREDKLGTMSLLSDYFPNILKNDFLLNALSFQNACLALTKPATVTGEFISPPFKFESQDLVHNLITEIADKQTGLVDPIQIQIVATKIERNIVEKAKLNGHAHSEILMVTKNDIPQLGDIINEFYANCWISLRSKLQLSDIEFERKKNNIISILVVNDRRDLVNSGWIIHNDSEELDQEIVSELLRSGLLREVPSGNDKFYQLCHDRFIKPVLEDQKKIELLQKEKEEKERTEKLEKDLEIEKNRSTYLKMLNGKVKRWNKIALSGIALCILLLVAVSILYKKAENEKKIAEEAEEIAKTAQAKAQFERDKSNTAIKNLAIIYIKMAENTILDNPSNTDLEAARLDLIDAKTYLNDTQNDSLIKVIKNKIADIDSKIKK